MIISKKRKSIPIIGILASVAILVGFLSYIYQGTSDAANVSKFDPGNLISDSVMSNKSTMNIQQIQAFLDSKNNCNNTNTHMAAWYPHLQYTIRDGKFVCMAKDSFGGQSAAQIIWQVAQDYSINPQVLIVLLEKEQGLVSDTWPNNVQYRTATGYGCPDTAPCDSQYFGLNNQLRQAASLFRTVLNGGWSNYPVGHTYVQYNPNGACGGSVINIQNRATSALYRYTPYQPNQSALNAGYGTGDSCGAYGNRNFWMLFTDWFGNTQDSVNFTPLETPRWMQVRYDGVRKSYVYSGDAIDDALSAGRQIKFIDKIKVNDKWYLRTEFNHKDNGQYGIEQSKLQDIPYQPIEPRWITLKEDGNRSHPASRTGVGGKLTRGTSIKVVDQITVDENLYLRTEYNNKNNQDIGINSRFISDFMPIQLDDSRNFCPINSKVDKINPQVNEVITPQIDGIFLINKKVLINDVWYFQEESDNGTLKFINSNELTDFCYVPFEDPRSMVLNKDSTRLNPYTGVRYDTLRKGSILSLSTKLLLNGQWYYRTEYSTSHNIDVMIRSSDLSEL